MDNEENKIMVPYIVHEGAMARSERHIKRLTIALVVAIVVILLSNLAWLYMWNSYDYASDYSEVSLESEDGGNANYIGNDGDISNGESESKESNKLP